ncbi:uncharacterized protein B0T15DRAFT_543075 [Chaetomium strumarium]|uniref:Uncharacterized protein n=1 Tax=Chaetomium strumarium TaxID=1170767 RepID=A0AAJ0GM39_9PEZI|nr:hypothetical protein B0T15DRAFT_543075 [Chaetomium strumarium]
MFLQYYRAALQVQCAFRVASAGCCHVFFPCSALSVPKSSRYLVAAVAPVCASLDERHFISLRTVWLREQRRVVQRGCGDDAWVAPPRWFCSAAAESRLGTTRACKSKKPKKGRSSRCQQSSRQIQLSKVLVRHNTTVLELDAENNPVYVWASRRGPVL